MHANDATDSEQLASAYDRLRSLVIRGRLAPGARVTEADVATRLGVSRTPARQAIQRLVLEGLLIPAGGGLRPRVAVAPLSAESARELDQAAGVLEGLGARGVEALDMESRARCVERLEEVEAAFHVEAGGPRPDLDRLFELHGAFHHTLMESCAGPHTRTLLDAIRPQLDRIEWLYAPLIGRFEATYDEHRAIIEAVRGGSADEAEQAVRTNWFAAAERLVGAMRRLGADGFARALAIQLIATD
jgi:DNA-binding GntR family transcriptional regulator